MKKITLSLLVLFCVTVLQAQTAREEFLLEKNWKFTKGDYPDAIQNNFNDKSWQSVTVPHDWAIY